MKSHAFLNTEDVSETNRQRFHVPLHQITGEIMHKYTEDRGNSAYLVQQQTENEAPLFSVESSCIKTVFISTTLLHIRRMMPPRTYHIT